MKSLLGLLVISLLVGCAQKLAVYDYDPKQDYASFQRYNIHKSDRNNYQSLDDARIEAAIKQALQERYTLAETEVDFELMYYLEADRTIDQSGFSFGFGVASSNVGVGATTRPEAKERIEGRLVLEVLDKTSGQVVWSAKANKNLRDTMKPDERAALINQLVVEMLANFPPQL